MHASTKARFEQAYKDLAHRLALPGHDDPNVDVLRLVYDWLCDETNGTWIMIVDNADEVDTFFSSTQHGQNEPVGRSLMSLAAYLPQSRNGSILITSRNKDVAFRLTGSYRRIQDVSAMNETEALYLLRNKLLSTEKETGATDLLCALGHIPLAITQAAAYINRRTRWTASDYLAEFRRSDKMKESLLHKDTGDLRRDETASNSVVISWQISFEHLREERSSAADLLSLISFFNPQGIPESILRRYSQSVEDTLNKGEHENTFDEDFDTLQAYSLVVSTAETDVCEMHPLVQFCTQIWLSQFGDMRLWKQRFVKLMDNEFPIVDFSNWAICQQLLPHVESLHNGGVPDDDSVSYWTHLLHQVGWYMQEVLGKLEQAEKMHRLALEGRRKLRVQSSGIHTSLCFLAVALTRRGNHTEAEELIRQALEGIEREFGAHDDRILNSLHILAETLLHQRKYQESEEVLQRALGGRGKEQRYQGRETLFIMSSLGKALKAQGKYNEAEEIQREVLEARKITFGTQHFATLRSMANLAAIWGQQGRYDEAEILCRQALIKMEEGVGTKHPATLDAMDVLGDLARDQARYEEAAQLYQRAITGAEQMFDVQDQWTAQYRRKLSFVQEKQAQQAALQDKRTSGTVISRIAQSKHYTEKGGGTSLYMRFRKRMGRKSS